MIIVLEVQIVYSIVKEMGKVGTVNLHVWNHYFC